MYKIYYTYRSETVLLSYQPTVELGREWFNKYITKFKRTGYTFQDLVETPENLSIVGTRVPIKTNVPETPDYDPNLPVYDGPDTGMIDEIVLYLELNKKNPI